MLTVINQFLSYETHFYTIHTLYHFILKNVKVSDTKMTPYRRSTMSKFSKIMVTRIN